MLQVVALGVPGLVVFAVVHSVGDVLINDVRKLAVISHKNDSLLALHHRNQQIHRQSTCRLINYHGVVDRETYRVVVHADHVVEIAGVALREIDGAFDLFVNLLADRLLDCRGIHELIIFHGFYDAVGVVLNV